MTFGDFEYLLRRNQAPSTSIHCAINPQYPNTVAIYDGNLPYRKNRLKTKCGAAHDWEIQSFVANCHWDNGEISEKSFDGEYDYVRSEWKVPMYRGWKATIKLLLGKGILRPSKELSELLRCDSREQAANHVRIYYED